MATINTFRNVRARLTRQGHAAPLSGWVTHLVREEARMRLWNYVPLVGGERVRCECFSQGTVARFNGAVIAQAREEIAIRVVGTIAYGPSEETPRIFASGLEGELKGPHGNGTMVVLDVSPVSLGVMVDAEFSPTDELHMEMGTAMGPLSAKVSIANVRPDPTSPGCFRMGLHIVDMGRLDRARWGRLIAEHAEA